MPWPSPCPWWSPPATAWAATASCWSGAQRTKKLYGLNGSGLAPRALSAQKLRDMGYTQMPVNGWLPTMVPGAAGAWAELRRRFGSMSMAELMAPAMAYAREGYPVPLNVHRLWLGEARRFSAAAEKEPEVFATWLEYFTKNGEAYGPGELFRMPDYAASLESLAATDCESLYRGELRDKILAFSKRPGAISPGRISRITTPCGWSPSAPITRAIRSLRCPPTATA